MRRGILTSLQYEEFTFEVQDEQMTYVVKLYQQTCDHAYCESVGYHAPKRLDLHNKETS